MNPYEAIKLLALRSVLKPDPDYFVRKICRWFSTTYHTPISQVYDMPIEEVLQAYFEAKYDAMDPDDLQAELATTVETEDQRRERLLAEDFDKMTEYELFQMSEKANKKKPQHKLSDIAVPKDKALHGKLNELTKTLKNVAESIKKEMESDPAKLPPDIEMTFESDEAFAKLLDSDSNSNSNKE